MRLFFICVLAPVIIGFLISLSALILDSIIQYYIDEAFTECDMLTMEKYKGVIHAYTMQHYSFSRSACGDDCSSAES